MGFQLATGQVTQAQFEQKAIGELLTQQYVRVLSRDEVFVKMHWPTIVAKLAALRL